MIWSCTYIRSSEDVMRSVAHVMLAAVVFMSAGMLLKHAISPPRRWSDTTD